MRLVASAVDVLDDLSVMCASLLETCDQSAEPRRIPRDLLACPGNPPLSARVPPTRRQMPVPALRWKVRNAR
ncbi:hypothetical protein SCA03_20070 [Streptomyces cacaoi]|uniref:Uncharacterized protein n=1 Tax=Streptomyces cacaoi TaxID=1898 RepID=A0A4Y3QVL9_STRCI|nr:hypothetical protein SCA03_20070 [Streptomyces cacaoi]